MNTNYIPALAPPPKGIARVLRFVLRASWITAWFCTKLVFSIIYHFFAHLSQIGQISEKDIETHYAQKEWDRIVAGNRPRDGMWPM
jgi:L-alanine-DL-glutamate epimerase-like enolase superfamily enzyme